MHTAEIYGWNECNSSSYSITKKKVYLEDDQTTADYIRDLSCGYWFTTFSEAKAAIIKELQDQKKYLAWAINDAKTMKVADCK